MRPSVIGTGNLGGGSSTKIKVLGRLRKITLIKGKKYVTYKGERILLSQAKKLEKTHAKHT